MTALLRSQPDFEVVAEASSASDAVRQCRETGPTVALLALHLPSTEGTTALSVIRAAVPDLPILAIAERGEGQCLVLNPPRTGRVAGPGAGNGCSTGTDCLQLAVTQGATGTIRRSAEAEELFRAVRTVASGQAWYEAGTAAAIMRHALAQPGGGGRPSLSDRETEVAELISDGRSNKEIAQALEISEPTVKKHVGHILGKLRLQDRLQVGLYIARNPLVLRRPPGPGA
jgi:DNA-binding NarL/FixJ family response regulator